MKVWRFRSSCNKDLALSSPIDYFKENFIAERMGEKYPRPSYIHIDGKSKRLRDFVSWMLSAPVVSEKAVKVLEPLIGTFCEILPLIELRGKNYYALNVLKLVDCLDLASSDIHYADDNPSHILRIRRYKFLEEKIPADIPIFKIPEDIGSVFVTRLFIDIVIANKLHGAAFEDPSVDSLSKIIKGESLNVIPELMED